MPPDNLLCHTGGFAWTNGYAFAAPDGWIGVDAPAEMAEWLRERKIKLSALLLTHSHFDHVEDAAAIREHHGCPIYAWQPSTPESRLEHWVQAATGMRLVVRDYPVDEILAGRDEITVCGLNLALAHVPGHSPDSVTFFDSVHQRLFTGDTLMQGTLGRSDFPGGSMETLLRGIREKLLPLGDGVTIFPGHGDSSHLGQERAWVNQLWERHEF